MRTTADRIRHALAFEILGIALITPLGALVFNHAMHEIGVVGVVGATIAMVWNYIYNLGFDHAMLRIRGRVEKTLAIRLLHTLLFEFGLLLALMPFIAWYLGIGLFEALLMDLSFAGFYLVYGFVFNWGYDLVFPLRETRAADGGANPARP